MSNFQIALRQLPGESTIPGLLTEKKIPRSPENKTLTVSEVDRNHMLARPETAQQSTE